MNILNFVHGIDKEFNSQTNNIQRIVKQIEKEGRANNNIVIEKEKTKRARLRFKAEKLRLMRVA